MEDARTDPPLRGRPHPLRWILNCPKVILFILIPSWIFWFFMGERDDEAINHLLFYYIPDLLERPWRLILNLTITPLINTESDQIILISVLVGVFGILTERRLGGKKALALFWGASASAALFGGLLWHFLHPLFPDIYAIERGGERVFNGASAGGFGLLAAYAAMSPRPWLWIGLFCIWEPNFWVWISRDYTSVFHVIAFITGFISVRYWLGKRRN